MMTGMIIISFGRNGNQIKYWDALNHGKRCRTWRINSMLMVVEIKREAHNQQEQVDKLIANYQPRQLIKKALLLRKI